MKTICITSSKGGAGKTTATFEIAAALKVLGKKVLVIDMDQRRGLTKRMGQDYSKEEKQEYNIKTIYDLLTGYSTLDEAIIPCEPFDLIIGDKKMEKPERTFTEPDDPFLIDKVKEQMELDGIKYDYLFLDHGPQNDIVTEMNYVSSDQIFVTSFRDMESLDDAYEVVNEIVKRRHQKNNQCKGDLKGFILGRYEKGSVTDFAYDRIQNEILPVYKEESDDEIPVFQIRKAADFEKAQVFGQPLTYRKRSTPAARDVYEIAQYIIDINK